MILKYLSSFEVFTWNEHWEGEKSSRPSGSKAQFAQTERRMRILQIWN